MTSIQLAVFSSIETAGSVHQHLTQHLIETVPIPPPPHTHPRLSRSPPPSSADPPPPPARARAPPRPRYRKPPPPLPALAAMTAQLLAFVAEAVGEEDRPADLPEELLVLVFGPLGSDNRKPCSLICCRWLNVEAASHARI
ncbi:hypothetical protein PVAP13_1NG309619 [Panicum virgatum]|uniref:F-box domain-containing protein n=1 Tax=Panicum virgatum TaxID=38727 RepID=A0A8T0WV54_PANVG|nr:hypothetical protein PVAP13_1NG309619 [Panicum virgatum]KAG2651730.1 hypothetical protein PVAP13_1NG309619 [Panicum virgatum]KAG2651731.1 hypothetical protein PVAP13_1NG309619 [Panicum virgatum]